MYVTGLEAELFYVRDGVVNKYAMMFVVPVNASVYDLEFSWQSLTSHPVIIFTNVLFTGSVYLVKANLYEFCLFF